MQTVIKQEEKGSKTVPKTPTDPNSKLVGFGRFRDMTYRTLLEQNQQWAELYAYQAADPSYSEDSASLHQEEEWERQRGEFVEWMLEQPLDDKKRRTYVINFGKRKKYEMSYEEVLDEDPSYAEWCVGEREIARKTSFWFRMFADWARMELCEYSADLRYKSQESVCTEFSVKFEPVEPLDLFSVCSVKKEPIFF